MKIQYKSIAGQLVPEEWIIVVSVAVLILMKGFVFHILY
jgi:hypothetical protein